MKYVTIDASVVLKWVLHERAGEDHSALALQLLQCVREKRVKVLQPPHWLAEVIAVIVRLQPDIAEEVIGLFITMDFPIVDTLEVYHLAANLSERYNQHLFDTLYHAVALNNRDTHFITADEKYYKKACHQGGIMRLADFSIF